eukprot:1066374-Amphidinium_carterae.1
MRKGSCKNFMLLTQNALCQKLAPPLIRVLPSSHLGSALVVVDRKFPELRSRVLVPDQQQPQTNAESGGSPVHQSIAAL